MEKHILSKSTFMSGVQCPKRFYLTKKGYQFGIEPDEVTPQQQAVFDTGTSVGELAQQLYPGGTDCTPSDFRNFGPSIEKAKQLIADGHAVIYEAAFQYDQVLAALDILVKKEDGWHAYEVKSTNSAKPQHVQDAAVQYWVISNSGIDLQSISILHFDKEYVKRGDLDIQGLFTTTDVTEQVEEILPTIRPQVKSFKAVLEEPEIPSIDIGPHCSSPYPCNFMGHCWKNVPEYSVLNLTNARGKQWDLYHGGIENVEDIPDDYPLNVNQRMQVQADRTGESFINTEALSQFLSDIQYPVYFMDFETIQPAIPIYDESRPYQMAVFQYSVHIQHEKNGPVEHREFLANPADRDLRRTVAQRLIEDMGTTGTVLVYNNSFEGPRLRELARDYPDLSNQLLAISDRIIDLAVPFRQKNYYLAEMHGRYSIKKVLPALVPELSYQDLEIQEGGTASNTFLQMVEGRFDGDEARTRNDLIEYCKLDTYAMVKLLEKLNEVTQ